MTVEIISQICAMLATMRADQKWTDNHAEAYALGLCDLPDAIGPILRKELLRRWEWRPSVKELFDFAQSLMVEQQGISADAIVAEIRHLITEYGDCAQPLPGFEHEFPFTRGPGAPNYSSPLVAKVVAVFGGWGPLCQTDMPSGTFTGLLLKAAQSVVENQTDATLTTLRCEYRQKCAELDAEQDSLPTPTPLFERSDTQMASLGASLANYAPGTRH